MNYFKNPSHLKWTDQVQCIYSPHLKRELSKYSYDQIKSKMDNMPVHKPLELAGILYKIN